MITNTVINIKEHRIPFWDVLKAFLIYLVILGHCIAPYRGVNGVSLETERLYRMIYEFHMPCFMLVSGYFASMSISKHGFRSLIRYAKRLLLPLVGFAVFQFLFLVDWANLRPIHVYGAIFDLWFLPVLFECVVAYYVVTICKSRLYRVCAFFVVWLASSLAIEVPYVNLVWVYCSSFVFMWPFFMLGSCINDDWIVKMKSYLWGGVSIALYISLLYLVLPGRYGWCGFFSVVTYTNFLMGLCGCASCLSLALWVTPYIQKCNILLKVGQSTLGIYILQFIYFCFPLSACFVLPFGNDYASIMVLALVITFFMWCIYSLTRKMLVFRLFLYGEARTK